jgi:hypothetical protein
MLTPSEWQLSGICMATEAPETPVRWSSRIPFADSSGYIVAACFFLEEQANHLGQASHLQQ